ncbi:MAG: hypothetical protein R2883_08175 [Caldisericia bacterium]
MDEVKTITNAYTTKISGETTPGANLTINGTKVAVSSTGIFETSVTLIDGINSINIVSRIGNLPPTSKVVTISVDAIPPEILLPKLPELIGKQTFTLKGRVEPNCVVTANGQPAKVVYDLFSVDVQLIPGKNEIKFNVIDAAGNITEKTMIIPVYKRIWGKLVVGNASIVDEEGLPIGQLRNPVTSVNKLPISVFESLFGAEYKVIESLGICEVNLFGNKYVFENGSRDGLVSGQSITLPTTPTIENGMLFISPEIVEQVFDCEITTNAVTGEITIARIWMP